MDYQDKVLLEKAAEVSGFKIQYWMEGCPMVVCAKQSNKVLVHPRSWNPLTDDGDALRLMAYLKINPYLCISIEYDNQEKSFEIVRRSIVLAASTKNRRNRNDSARQSSVGKENKL